MAGTGSRGQRAARAKETSPLSEHNIDAAELVAAARSLLEDELKPFGRVLLKRLRERMAAREALEHGLPEDSVDVESMPRIDPKRLRRACEDCRELIFQSEDGQEYSVIPWKGSLPFLDVCSPFDMYPAELWENVVDYLKHLPEDVSQLPGGRYESARVLSTRKLPFLAGFSLGRICHIVYIATSQRKLLGYAGGFLVPYEQSDAWKKEQCAMQQSPVTEASTRIASWDDVVMCMRKLLQSGDAGGVAISNIKRMVLSRFNVELSETALGHTRLQDVLCDPRLQEVCTLYKDQHGPTKVVRNYVPMLSGPPGVWVGHSSNHMVAVPALMTMPPLDFTTLSSESLLSPGASPREFDSSHQALDDEMQNMQSVALGSAECKDVSDASSESTASELSRELSLSSVSDLDGETYPPLASISITFGETVPSKLTIKNTFLEFVGAEMEQSSARKRAGSVPASPSRSRAGLF